MNRKLEVFLQDVAEEVGRAQEKFPDSNACLAALTEEVGELAQAMLSKPFQEIYKEALQVAAMAYRCAAEGDDSLTLYRRRHNAQGLPRLCPYQGCFHPFKQIPPCALCYE